MMENLSHNDEYQQVASMLPGITVFAPKPKLEKERKAQSYTCPQCGGCLAYNLVTSGLACQHCGYQANIRSRAIGPVAEKNEFTTTPASNKLVTCLLPASIPIHQTSQTVPIAPINANTPADST